MVLFGFDNRIRNHFVTTVQSQQEIQELAYHFWQERGCPWGSPETDWFRAERELTGANIGPVSLAREVGGALGTIVALVTEKLK
jgi:hypothetical protein